MLREVLNKYRENAKTAREKGEYFELLSKTFLENDSIQSNEYSQVWTYKDWASEQGVDGKDVGIDLVAKLSNEEGFCAVQCKFYDENHKIQRSDIDSFLVASSKETFKRRLFIDTTTPEWGINALEAIQGNFPPTIRISLKDLEESSIDWSIYAREGKAVNQAQKELRPHQQEALNAVEEGLSSADRGKLVMACGTGKTFTSLKIAEKLAGKGKRVLYLVPSLALMSQTVREWSNDTQTPLHSYAVCSDTQVGKRKAKDDLSDLNAHDLAFPATTKPEKLAEQFHTSADKMNVVFSTYQSIQVISDAQLKHDFPEFDLIICDEAHRTTGVTLSDADDSNFVKVHEQAYVKGKKRLYMTATPRVFGEPARDKANEVGAEICSMDDVSKYGETLYEITFSHAVEKELLTDYKVIVLAVDEETVSAAVQNRLTNEDSELSLDDVTKIIGCYRALSKLDLRKDLLNDPTPMKRAVAFCKTIEASKNIRNEFAEVVEQYVEDHATEGHEAISCETEHVDGTFNAKARNNLLDWLSADAGEHSCRILTNARCLSEGVDVPSLDAIMFLHPRKSQVDVIQSVGRVMRRAPGKKMGYVILPVGVPSGMSAEEALNNNEKYKVVWQILNALRSHDDRFGSYLNRIDLNEDIGKKIEIVVHSLPAKKDDKKPDGQLGSPGGSAEHTDADDNSTFDKSKSVEFKDMTQTSMLDFDEFQKAILARIVKKCGNVEYWEDWAADIAKIAQNHIIRINDILKEPNSKERKAFDDFLEEIKDDLNESITEADAVEMLAQHIITRPVFEELFKEYSFTQNNPVSKAMQKVIDALEDKKLDNENKSLEKFYNSVRLKVADIQTDKARQQLVVKLYDSFFKNAFPRTTDKLGIVYTPTEVVDFIIHSVNDVLQQEFGQSLGSKGVHILDPFTGTGTFITRLLQSGLIKPEELEYKFKNEIHANEIVLLAYYIAAINIEAAYHGLAGGDYAPFNGICLTDTFQLYEKDDMVSKLLVDNSHRRMKQKELDIRVIMGNPPYSSGDKNDNNNKNVSYLGLDKNISDTYVSNSIKQTGKSKMYDSYIRAFRWASNQIGDRGIVGYVSGSAWIERSFADGMRKCLVKEYSNLYIFHLRGDVRKDILSKGKTKEGGNVFDAGSMTGIAISILVKNPQAKDTGKVYFYDIGDDLTTKEKLSKIENLGSIQAISLRNNWQQIVPDKYGDWLSQRDENFDSFIEMGNKGKGVTFKIFETYSMGIKSNRDAWVYNYSQSCLQSNVSAMIAFYNKERTRLSEYSNEDKERLLNRDKSKIKWTSDIISALQKNKEYQINNQSYVTSIYKPFTKISSYINHEWNWTRHLMPSIFPDNTIPNRAIALSGVGTRSEFAAMMVNTMPYLHVVENGQCFPLKVYVKRENDKDSLFSEDAAGYDVKDGITNEGLKHFQQAYPNEDISKEDIFYYIYGLLHSEDYRTKYADNLSKQLPRIPCVKKASDFWAFSKAGRELGELHVNYEEVEPYAVTLESTAKADADYYVKKMKFGGKGKEKDKSTIIYNDKIKLKDIPLEAYDYVVNGKPAIEWVMERQCVKTDKASGITNDANLYATETMEDAAYPLKLLQRVITVSLETMKIVNNLPPLDIETSEAKKDVA